MADLLKLGRDLAALEQDPTLLDDDNLEARFEALRTLDFLVEAFQLQAGNQQVATGLLRARALQGDLGQRNQDLFRKLRTGIRRGMVSPGQLRTLFGSNCRYRPDFSAYLHWGPEAADALAAGVFNSDCPPQPWDGSDSEMIHYEPTPVSALLELVDRVPLTPADRFVDIGSGLGQVALLVHLLTGVEAIGLEVMPSYVNQARLQTAKLGIAGVAFRQGDARSADLCAGTVYFLFSPFRGEMLQTVIRRLRREACARQLTICSFGPCTEQIAAERWLTLEDAGMNHVFRLAVFRSGGESGEK